MSPSRVERCAPQAGGWIGAFVAVLTKRMAVGALDVGVEPQATLGPIC